jgi:transposase
MATVTSLKDLERALRERDLATAPVEDAEVVETCADPRSRGSGADAGERPSASLTRGSRLGLPRPSPTHVKFQDRRYRLGQRVNSKDTGRPLVLKEPVASSRTITPRGGKGAGTSWLVSDGSDSHNFIGHQAGSDAGVPWASKPLDPQVTVEPLEGEQFAGSAEHFLRREDHDYAETSKAWKQVRRGGGVYHHYQEREVLSSQTEHPEIELGFEDFLGLHGHFSDDFTDGLIARLDREREALPPSPRERWRLAWEELLAKDAQIVRQRNKIHHLKARASERDLRLQDDKWGRKFRRKLLRKFGLPTMTTRQWEAHLKRERKSRQREERDRRIIAYWALGYSDRQIKAQTGYGMGTIYDVLKEAKNRTNNLANSEEAEVQTAEIIRQLAAEDERSFQTRKRLIEELAAKHPDSELVQSAVDRFNEIALDATEEIAA